MAEPPGPLVPVPATKVDYTSQITDLQLWKRLHENPVTNATERRITEADVKATLSYMAEIQPLSGRRRHRPKVVDEARRVRPTLEAVTKGGDQLTESGSGRRMDRPVLVCANPSKEEPGTWKPTPKPKPFTPEPTPTVVYKPFKPRDSRASSRVSSLVSSWGANSRAGSSRAGSSRAGSSRAGSSRASLLTPLLSSSRSTSRASKRASVRSMMTLIPEYPNLLRRPLQKCTTYAPPNVTPEVPPLDLFRTHSYATLEDPFPFTPKSYYAHNYPLLLQRVPRRTESEDSECEEDEGLDMNHVLPHTPIISLTMFDTLPKLSSNILNLIYTWPSSLSSIGSSSSSSSSSSQDGERSPMRSESDISLPPMPARRTPTSASKSRVWRSQTPDEAVARQIPTGEGQRSRASSSPSPPSFVTKVTGDEARSRSSSSDGFSRPPTSLSTDSTSSDDCCHDQVLQVIITTSKPEVLNDLRDPEVSADLHDPSDADPSSLTSVDA